MARLASSPSGFLHHHLALPLLRPRWEPPRCRIDLRLRSIGPRRGARLRCLVESESVEPLPVESTPEDEVTSTLEPETPKENRQDSDGSKNVNLPEFPNRNVNRRIALTSSVAAVGVFLSRRLDFGVSLKDLSANATPYEEALSNGKPTVLEFYADWCEVCRELAPQIFQVEQQYRDRVNFVMLNVDNTKWEQELDEFGVEGIPHFAFLDKDGNEEGNIVGRLPKQYFLENVVALLNGEATIPHAQVVGQFSSAEARKVHQVADPRSHG
ncbi:thioredoxin-like protein HCF164, chloroplastic [Curcuma longa]|uniref:thioredoxin-like protein HCF164, chloroplastic n=1 Tax=Curcuma longa TaxID=136217 RepID=UPI003D9F9337